MEYLLYDVPWLVRDPNAYRMSEKRHQIEVRNQAVVDDYFVARANGASAHEAREVVATKHGMQPMGVRHALDWFFHEAKKRRKYDFLQKFGLWVKMQAVIGPHRLFYKGREAVESFQH